MKSTEAASYGDRRMPARFWAKVRIVESGCWEWAASKNADGYGNFQFAGARSSHRAAYITMVGPVARGMQLDHLCRNRACCNPTHLEPVSLQENLRRGINGNKTHCWRGHPFTEANTYTAPTRGNRRQCLACIRERSANIARAARVKGLRLAEYLSQFGAAERTALSIINGSPQP